jgi:hypothetical protein
MTNRKENNQYDQNGNPTYLDFGKGSYSKRTYNEKGEIIFDEGIGNKSFKPYWYKWERYYFGDGSKEVHHSRSDGYWEESRYNKCGKCTDYMNSIRAKRKDPVSIGELHLYGKVIPC